LQIVAFFQYVYRTFEQKPNKREIILTHALLSFTFSFIYIVWYMLFIIIIIKIPQVASYGGSDYEAWIVLLILVAPLLLQYFLFDLGLKGSQSGRFPASGIILPVTALFLLLFFYPGPASFMRGTLITHSLGGGVVATLSMRGGACQHLNELIKEPPRAAPEEVCTTIPVAILLNTGDTIYIQKASSAAAAAEPDGKQPTSDEDNNPLPDGAENVWSVDRSAVIGMEFQPRGQSKWLTRSSR
jgi:hypothetical protein